MLKPKTVVALAVVLAIGGVALRGLLRHGRAEREQVSGSSAATEALQQGAELSPPLAAVREDEAKGAGLEARTEVAPGPAGVRAPKIVEPPRGDARLQLEVVSRAGEFPLASIPLTLVPHGKNLTTQNSQRGVTNDQGSFEFAVASETEYRLHLRPEPDEGESRRIAVPPLARGETRALRVEISTGNDLAWWGLVLDGETERPPADASFALVRSIPQGTETYRPVGPDGRIEAEVATWREDPKVVAVRAPGYATAYALPSALHASSEAPQRVLLWRAAALQLRLDGGDGEPSLSVSTDSSRLVQVEGRDYVHWIDATWKGSPAAGGVVLYQDLPAKIEITVKATLAGRVLRQEAIILEPGERRELYWKLATGASIDGHAVEHDGAAVAGLEVWLLNESQGWGALLTPSRAWDLVGKAETGGDGRFSFEDVAPGQYLVGPSPRPSFDASLRDIAPQAVRVAIDPGVTRVPVELVCWRGLEIRGRLLDPEGRPARGFVSAYGADGHVSEETLGTFALGPLTPGTYRVNARSYSLAYSESVEVMAQAGDEGLELRLQAGGSLSVRVLDEERRPVKDIEVSLVPADERLGGGTYRSTDSSGEVHIDGVLPGSYLVVAAGGMRLAVRSEVEIAVGPTKDVLELVLAPAVLLKVRQATRDPAHAFRVRWGGHALRLSAFDGLEAEVLLPPGDVTVELLDWSSENGLRVLQEKRLLLGVGEPASVTFDAVLEPR